MNLSMNDVRLHLTTWFNWWLGGWQDAWAMLPKPAALQTRPAVFQSLDGSRLAFHASLGTPATWHNTGSTDTPQGLLLSDDDILLRTLNLPSLGESDIAAAVAMDVQFASPFPASDTHYGYSTHRQPSGQLGVEIAITRQSQLEQRQAMQPQQLFFARGQHGAIPLQGGTGSSTRAWFRSPLTLGLLALLGIVLIAWIISPTLLLRAKVLAHEAVLARLSSQAAPLLQKREELSTLQQHLENAHAFDSEHPAPQPILEQLSSQIPDSTWISQLNLHKDQLTLEGSSDNAVAIVSLLEKIPALNEVRLGASINRDPRNGRETFQILARIQVSTPSTIPASGAKP